MWATFHMRAWETSSKLVRAQDSVSGQTLMATPTHIWSLYPPCERMPSWLHFTTQPSCIYHNWFHILIHLLNKGIRWEHSTVQANTTVVTSIFGLPMKYKNFLSILKNFSQMSQLPQAGSTVIYILQQKRWLEFSWFPPIYMNSLEWQVMNPLLILSSPMGSLPISKEHGNLSFLCTHQMNDNYFRSCYIRIMHSIPHLDQTGSKLLRFGITLLIEPITFSIRYVEYYFTFSLVESNRC